MLGIPGHASPCYSSPCQQTCTVLGNGESYTCGCFEGYIADPLNSSLCLLNAQGCKEEFLCHGDCIPWELTCDGVNHCIPKSENTFPADEDPYFCGNSNIILLGGACDFNCLNW